MQERRQPEIIAGRTAGDGTIVGCTDPGVTVAKGATGVYNYTFPPGFRMLGLTASAADGSNRTSTGNLLTDRTGQIVIYTASTAAAADVGHSWVAVGVQQ